MKGFPPPYPIVEIEWIDSRCPNPNWRYMGDLGPPKAVLCTSVGYLTGESATAITLVQSLGDLDLATASHQANGAGDIPKKAILKRVVLRKGTLK